MEKRLTIFLALLCASLAFGGCAISQTCIFFPRSNIETTEKGWNIVPGGNAVVFVVDKRDASTESVYGWVEQERLFLEIRSLKDDYSYFLPGDVKVHYYMKRGDKSDFTRSVEGVVEVRSKSPDFVVLYISVAGELFGERHSIAGIYGFNRSERSAPDPSMETKPRPTESQRNPLSP